MLMAVRFAAAASAAVAADEQAAPSVPTMGPFARSCTPSSTTDAARSQPGWAPACATAAADLLADADLVVPVPLHRSRRRRRGFNQARELAAQLGVPMVDALRRTRATPSQTDLPADERHENMRNAFALRRWYARPRLQGLRVVLVDDVSTTGATIEACAEVAARGWRRGRQRGDGSPSRVSTERMTSAATSPFARSPSRRTQPDAAACRR